VHRGVLGAIGAGDGSLARRLTEENIERQTFALIERHLARTATADSDR
jgi:hypothetical protein